MNDSGEKIGTMTGGENASVAKMPSGTAVARALTLLLSIAGGALLCAAWCRLLLSGFSFVRIACTAAGVAAVAGGMFARSALCRLRTREK